MRIPGYDRSQGLAGMLGPPDAVVQRLVRGGRALRTGLAPGVTHL